MQNINKGECNDYTHLETSSKTICLMFNFIIFIILCKYLVILSLTQATALKKVVTGATKDLESCGMTSKQQKTTGSLDIR